MYAYRTPGAYFEWQDASAFEPTFQRTDIAGFVGIAARGPLHRAVKVESWSQFAGLFGGHIAQGFLAYAVEGFFANGGRTCWVVRVADPDEAACAKLTLLDGNGQAALRLEARYPGTWAHQLLVKVLHTSKGRFALLLRLTGGGEEVWPNLSLVPTDPRYVYTLLKEDKEKGGASQWVSAKDPFLPAAPLRDLPAEGATGLAGGQFRFADGCDGLASLDVGHFSGDNAPAGQRWGLGCLEEVDSVAIVAMPDIMPKPRYQAILPIQKPANCEVLDAVSDPPVGPGPQDEPVYPPDFDTDKIQYLQTVLVNHCENLKNRVAILDPHPDWRTREEAIAWRGNFDTSYAAAYFPWLMVRDPLGLEGLLRLVPPSGHLAGVFARGDLRVGAHKPPANQVLEGVQEVGAEIDDASHGILNDAQVNAIRVYPGRGVRVVGARTLSSDRNLLYLNVRRLLVLIRRTIEEHAQSLVFEPNNQDLWRRIDRIVRALLDRLWRAGMLEGAKAEKAYSVRCDAETNPPYEQDNGRVICEAGVLPPWPAEFVVVRIGFTQAGAELLEGGG